MLAESNSQHMRCNGVPEPGTRTHALLVDERWHEVTITGWPRMRYGLGEDGARMGPFQLVAVRVEGEDTPRRIAIERLAELRKSKGKGEPWTY